MCFPREQGAACGVIGLRPIGTHLTADTRLQIAQRRHPIHLGSQPDSPHHASRDPAVGGHGCEHGVAKELRGSSAADTGCDDVGM